MAEQKKILIVEDDKFLAKMLGRMLETEKYSIVLAPTAEEARDKVGKLMPDLILLDIMLPDSDGFKVLEHIKSDAATKDIPVIIMSNLGQPEDITQGKNLGAIDHLIKSDLGLDEVVAKIDHYIGEKNKQ